MDRRTIVSLGLGALSVACAVGVFDRGLPNAQVTVEPLAEGEAPGVVHGVIVDGRERTRRKDALIILDCACLGGQREMQTDAEGVFRFRRLPPGKYTVQVLSGQATAKQGFELGPAGQVRVDFWLPKYRDFIMT